MRSLVQRELDKAEEYIIKALFKNVNNPILSNKIRLLLVAKNIDFDKYVNNAIMIFEEFSQDFMKENGYFDGEKLTKALLIKYPSLKGLNIPDMKPIEILKVIDNFVNLETIGDFIQNF